nr:unnamed protein product [Spirometra erinaceieuropaei]
MLVAPSSQKPNEKHADLGCAHLATPTPNRPRHVHGISKHSGRQLDLLDTFEPTAALRPHHPSSLCPPLPRLLRRQLILAALPNHHFHPPPSPPYCLNVCRYGVCHAHQHYTQTNTNNTTVDASGGGLVCICPQCNRAFTSHVRPVVHLRTHRTEAGEPVPGAPTYTCRIRSAVHIALTYS